MRRSLNLTAEIRTQFPDELVAFIEQAGRLAADKGEHIYLVGGTVRDLLLRRPNLDLDLVVEGDVISLAQHLAAITSAKLVIHIAFKTANLRWDRWSVDLATARSETYKRPGALPTVQPGPLMADLYRRDFTINAMAIELNPKLFGKLIDHFGGRIDLMTRQIRVLHEKSFIDDATRIWRAIRYEQRLGFRLEFQTRRILMRDIPMLDTISGDRIRHELELVLREKFPEKALRRAGALGVLRRLSPPLKADRWLASKFRQARRVNIGALPGIELYFALLGYHLSGAEAERLVEYLRPNRNMVRALEETISLRTRLDTITEARIASSKIYRLLNEYTTTAIIANQIAVESPLVRHRLALYLAKLRYVKSSISGDDLIKMGIPPGPRMKIILRDLLEARLDGKAGTKEDEMKLVKKYLEQYQ